MTGLPSQEGIGRSNQFTMNRVYFSGGDREIRPTQMTGFTFD
jgi:hypothetical protein